MAVFENPAFLKHELNIQLGNCFDQVLPASPPVPAQEMYQR